MLTNILFAFALLLQPTSAPTTNPNDQVKSLTPAEATQVIDRFLADPKMGDEAREIKKFAEESDACVIAIDEQVAPWAAHNPPYPQLGVLLTSYVAGDVKAQLQAHKAEDNPYAGMLAVIQTYEKLRKADAKVSIPEVDDMIAMEKRGELKAHADEIVKNRQK